MKIVNKDLAWSIGIAVGLITPHLILGIASIAIGSCHLGDCPRRNMIPAWLLVNGCVILLLLLLAVLYYALKARISDRFKKYWNASTITATVILTIVYITWIITGSVLVYPLNKDGDHQNNDPNLSDYCHDAPYKGAMAILIIQSILLGFVPIGYHVTF